MTGGGGGSRSGSAARPMPVLGRVGQPPSPQRSSPLGSGARPGCLVEQRLLPSGIRQGGPLRDPARGCLVERRLLPPDPARAAAAGPAWHTHLVFRKDGRAALLTKEELLVPISLTRSLRELRRMYYSAPVLEARPEENTPYVLWRRTPVAPKSPEKSANPQSKRYRIGRFGGIYGQSKLSNILHTNELASDLRFSNFIGTCIKPPRLASGRPNYHCSGCLVTRMENWS
ncbi:uncharacterized protein LOC120647431 isoform X2 [Panicum virgatum]|uniref:uncharacterized protein LOC120647431 isoform X2 n=1 Tax=Panicum virgatum TaxID=38727 RepID=UPI0019D64C53|nr:uncharacterized protein LOC120647431 isoform X2 [Panicum virgatum]